MNSQEQESVTNSKASYSNDFNSSNNDNAYGQLKEKPLSRIVNYTRHPYQIFGMTRTKSASVEIFHQLAIPTSSIKFGNCSGTVPSI